MLRRPIENTQRKAQRSKSQAIRQTSSGNKNLKLTNKGQNIKTLPSSKQKKDQYLLRISTSPKTKKVSQKQTQSKQQKLKRKTSNQSINIKQKSIDSKQKNRKKVVSYKQSDKQSQQLKKSVVDIQFPNLDDPIDDDINMLSISNYPIKDNDDFLRGTCLADNLSKVKVANQNVKKDKHCQNQKLSPNKIRKTNSKKAKNSQNKNSRSKTASEKKQLLKSNHKTTLQKSTKKLQKSNTGLKVSYKPLQKSTKGGLSKTKKGKKQKSSSTQTNKGNSAKKDIKTLGKVSKSPVPVNLPKQIPKPIKQKQKQTQKKKPSTIRQQKAHQQSQSQTTKTPTFEQLQKLRQQNEKYKFFLANSAFKVQQLKKQIQQHKQIRQNERNIYNFQLNNLKKQLDANKKYLGHLYSYDDHPNNPATFIPDQIIIQTDNESSSVLDSINMLSNMSKKLNVDQNYSDGSSNKIRKSNQSDEGNKQLTNKNQLNNIIKDIKYDLLKQEAQLKYLADIKKIPSLQVRISLGDSEPSIDRSNQNKNMNQTDKAYLLKTPYMISSANNDQIDSPFLLINSIGK